MPALKKTEFVGEVTFLGRVVDREAGLQSERLDQVELEWGGIAGEAHGGLTRKSCSRVASQYPKNTEIRNVRALSVVSHEELAVIAQKTGLDQLDPTLLGASLVISGIPDSTHIPPSSRLVFASGASLTVDMENRPCVLPAKVIETEHDGHGKGFKAAAKGMRGVTAWVERPGEIALGDHVTLHIPDQRMWAHMDTARS